MSFRKIGRSVLLIAKVGHSGVMQSALKNCWFEASLSAVADSPEGPSKIADMITANPYGYVVRFPGLDTPVEVKYGEITSAALVDPAKRAAVLEVARLDLHWSSIL